MPANSHRLAKVREFDAEMEPTVHQLIAELVDCGDEHWVLVEGFKHASLPKIPRSLAHGAWRGADVCPG